MVKFDNEFYKNISSKEWIVTNGIGGYASSSICGANTRRYHGLLIASFNPPTDRKVVVSNIEEKISVGDKDYFICTHQYPDTVYPNGFLYLKSFEINPLPKSHYASLEFSITKTIFMIYGSNTTVIEYQNTGDKLFTMELTPLFVYRDYHQLFRESHALEFKTIHAADGKLNIFPNDDEKPIHVHYSKGNFSPQQDWYRNFEYLWEKERGLDFREDAKSTGSIQFELAGGEKFHLIFSVEDNLPDGDPAIWKTHEELRLKSLFPSGHNDFIKDLMISGDQFIVWRLTSKSLTLIAGYHWFTDWGRDTMIAMRGLVIAAGKKQIAESILQTFLLYLNDGMIPNRFPDLGQQPEYNTIDASLWIFIAMFEYYQQFGDKKFVEIVFPSLNSIIQAHIQGTRYNIHVTEEGLLSGGEENVQLTWMDARVGDHVVTPRRGCPVEINSLWYNALNIYVEFGKMLGYDVSGFKKKAAQTKSAFRKYFINEKGYLNDIVIPGELMDDAIRPNQVYAVSLPFSPLTLKEGKNVLKTIEEHLYTDFGLRSLSPYHPDFKPVYSGGQWQRDHAYHQGTVWAYLWGEYAMAYLKVHHHSAEAKQIIRQKSKALEHHFYNEDGLNSISEIFDGDNPKHGKGCIQQAWSIGMTIKALLEAEE